MMMKEEEEEKTIFRPHWPLPPLPVPPPTGEGRRDELLLHLTTTVIRFLARLAVEEGAVGRSFNVVWTKKVAAESA
jgi:hypothetical protein